MIDSKSKFSCNNGAHVNYGADYQNVAVCLAVFVARSAQLRYAFLSLVPTFSFQNPQPERYAMRLKRCSNQAILYLFVEVELVGVVRTKNLVGAHLAAPKFFR